MKKIKTPVSIAIVFALAVSMICSGCILHMEPAVYAKGFLDCIIKKDYKGAYERTYPYSAQSLTEKDFIKKYTDIADALKITSITVTEGTLSESEDSATYTYTAKYVTEKYGDFTNTYTMLLRPYEDTMRVDWNPNLIFPEMDFGDKISISTLKGERGEILSSDSVPLAKNDYAQTVFVNLTKAGEFTAFGPALCEKLQLKQEDLKKKYDKAVKNEDDLLIVNAYPKEHFDEAALADLKTIPGVDVDAEKYTDLRFYPLEEACSHLLGYTSAPDEKEAEKQKKAGLNPLTRIGAEGLEKAYEDKLRGTDGEAVTIKDELGTLKATLYKKAAVNGCDLVLSINAKLQEKAYNLLASYLSQGRSGVAIVMNAQTGEVEAAASYPSFDNNMFSFPISKATWDQFMKKENKEPLYNRITLGQYPPGSVLKPFTIAASLEEGKVTPETPFPFENEIQNNKWKPSLEGWNSELGITRVENSGSPIKLKNALLASDNIYFAWAATQLGGDKMIEYMKKYTLGQAMPFELPAAPSNIINASTSMYLRLLAEMGYGQGEILVTPIQLASMYSAFCNNGDMIKPTLVKKLMRQDGIKYETVEEVKPSVLAKSVFKQSTLDILLPLLEDVVKSPEGTGHPVNMQGVRIAGKTGTAELGQDKSREISWFAGFWLDQTEKRLVIVMVDVPEGEGKLSKFDIAKALLTPAPQENTPAENTSPANTGPAQ